MFLDTGLHNANHDRYELPDQEVAFSKNRAYELRKFGPQPDTGHTTAHAQQVNVYERILADEGKSHPVYANVNF